jgi:hypothetical protein
VTKWVFLHLSTLYIPNRYLAYYSLYLNILCGIDKTKDFIGFYLHFFLFPENHIHELNQSWDDSEIWGTNFLPLFQKLFTLKLKVSLYDQIFRFISSLLRVTYFSEGSLVLWEIPFLWNYLILQSVWPATFIQEAASADFPALV